MASFSVPCPKISASLGTLQPNSKQRRSSISFRSGSKSNRALLAGSSLDNSAILGFQASNRNQYEVLRVSSQLNEVAIEKSKNSIPVPETKSEDSTKKSASVNTIPDASSISAFMNQVADLVELVDSTDIMELQLKQRDCEVLIRKKEALPQPPVTAPYVMMQSHSPQAMVLSQLLQAQAAPASAGLVASPTVSAAPPTSEKPKSSHPPLKCPMAGTLYRCPAPGAPPFVKRLEFLGDSVLDILITWYLYQSHKELDPGELTDLRSAFVNNEYFAQATVRRNLHLHLQHCSGLLLSQIKEYAEFVSGSRSTTKSSQVAKRLKVKEVDRISEENVSLHLELKKRLNELEECRSNLNSCLENNVKLRRY